MMLKSFKPSIMKSITVTSLLYINTALPVAVNKRFAEFATHCGTDTSINAIPDFANSFCSLTKIGFNSSDGNDESAFLMISLGQM